MFQAEQLARLWIQAWIDGDPDSLPLSKDFCHSSPFGKVQGREKYLEWVKPLAKENVNSLKILKTLGDDSEAVIWFEMKTPKALIQCCDWIHARNGEISKIHSFYDASQL